MTSTFTLRHTKVIPDDGHGTVITLTTAADKGTFAPARPVNIVRWGIIVTTLLDVGAGAVFSLDFRPTIGSNTGRVVGSVSGGVDTAGGSITLSADVAVGKGVYHDVNPPLKVNPGEQVVVDASDAPDTGGAGYLFFEYEEEGFSGGSPAPAGSLANRISNLTKVAS